MPELGIEEGKFVIRITFESFMVPIDELAKF